MATSSILSKNFIDGTKKIEESMQKGFEDGLKWREEYDLDDNMYREIHEIVTWICKKYKNMG